MYFEYEYSNSGASKVEIAGKTQYLHLFLNKLLPNNKIHFIDRLIFTEDTLERVIATREDPLQGEEPNNWTLRYRYNRDNLGDDIILPSFGLQYELGLDIASEAGISRVGEISVSKVLISHFKDLNRFHECIVGSGHDSKEHARKNLSKIYKPIYGKGINNNSLIMGLKIKNFKLY